ncbi:MAG: thioredoxin [Ruthenibacterium sp.]
MMSIEITTQNFETEVLKAETPVLVDFWASWCGPCRMLAPVIEELAGERADVKICKLNVDEQGALAQQFNVMSIPTVIAFKNGKEAGRSVGLVPKEKLLALL